MDICELLTLSLFADPYPADKKTCIAVSVLYPVGSTRISRTRPKVFSEKWLLSCVPRCFTMSKKVGHGNKRRATPASPDQLVECMTSQVYYLRILICHKHVSPFIVALLHRCFLPPPPPPLLPSSIHLSIAPPFLSLLSSRDAPRATRRFSTHVRHAHAYVRERVARAPYERAMGARLPLCERWPKRHALVMVPLEFQI